MTDQTIAHYQIAELIGEGGMGQVFRATDTKLKRQVALKILPESFARDPQRMARFQREAEVLASLNHPGIAGIYGLEEEAGVHAIAMELVGGETLAAHISRGPIEPDLATKIGLQIAEAMEAAHERGITHRDLKPANVMVTPESTVKILDFGLAKAITPEVGSDANLTHSPTLTMQATQAGLILGTAAYMSPEQARGQPADKRADIWSFGVVLFEMLTGHSPFQEETISDSLAAVLRADLNWSLLPPSTPPHLKELLRRCLRRDVRQRLRDIGEVRIALEEPSSAELETEGLEVAGTGPRSLVSTVLPWSLLAMMLLFVAMNQWGGTDSSGTTQDPIAFSIHTSGWQLPVNFVDNPILDVSRDGQRFAWIGSSGNSTQLFVRSLDDPEVKAIPGTEDASSPFFSPDGEWIGFFASGKLKKVASRGANVQDVTEAGGQTRGAWWGANELIVFSPTYQSGLWEVPASSGVPQMLTELDEAAGERSHRFPQVLPGGDAILLTVGFIDAPSAYDDAHIAVYSRRHREMKTLIQGGHTGRYVPSGHLLFIRSGALLAVPFDLEELEVTGQAVLVHESIGREPSSGAGYFAVSDSGTLLYRPVESGESDIRIVLTDRQGMVTPLEVSGGVHTNPRFSPDGRQIAYTSGGGGGSEDVFASDLESSRETRITFQSTGGAPLWSPDGSRIYYSSLRQGQEGGIFYKAGDGSTLEARIFAGDRVMVPTSISSDRRLLLITTYNPTVHISLLELEEDGQVNERPFGTGQGYQWGATFSPDERWVAYTSNETGRDEIYVEPLTGGGRWQISTDGGMAPVWRGDGKELFFADYRGIYHVAIESTVDSFRHGKAELLFAGQFLVQTAPSRNYDVSPDGQRFVLNQSAGTGEVSTDLVVRLNWLEELKRLVPTEH